MRKSCLLLSVQWFRLACDDLDCGLKSRRC
jgi:hypothetical protein